MRSAGEAETPIHAPPKFRECRISSALPGDLAYLQAVADQLNTDKAPHEPERDGLGA